MCSDVAIIKPMVFFLLYKIIFVNHVVTCLSSPSQPYQFHVAPMQGYTNAPLRYLFRLLSPDVVLWTEMEKIRDLNEALASNNLQKRFGEPNPEKAQKLTLQVGGNDPVALERCIAQLNERGYTFEEINLNCGCPSIEAGGADFGASLMKQPELTRQLIEAIRQGCHLRSPSTKISLKCRTAVYETVEEMEDFYGNSPSELCSQQQEQFEALCSYISQAQVGGIEHVALHARPAVLAGLSSTKNRIIPPLDYDLVERVAIEFPDLRTTLNGGISSMKELDKLMSRLDVSMVDSHMSGRWMLQNPIAVATVQSKYLSSSNDKLEKDDHQNLFESVIDEYIQFVVDSLGEKVHTLSELCLPLYLLIENFQEEFGDGDQEPTEILYKQDKAAILPPENECYTIMKDALEHLVYAIPSKLRKSKAMSDEVNWKKLSTFLKSLVGTKVYNKWKRNRNELIS